MMFTGSHSSMSGPGEPANDDVDPTDDVLQGRIGRQLRQFFCAWCGADQLIEVACHCAHRTVNALVKMIEDEARSVGSNRIAWIGRRGWLRHFPEYQQSAIGVKEL